MGSWSESCGVSGLEISEQDDAYVCLLVPNSHQAFGAADLWKPATTFIRGSYDDYGILRVSDDPSVIKVFNEQSGLTLINDDGFDRDILENCTVKGAERFWIHSGVFDFLPDIKQDFGYHYSRTGAEHKSIKVKDIAESATLTLADIKTVYHKQKKIYDERQLSLSQAESTSPETQEIIMESALLLMEHSFYNVIGDRENDTNYLRWFQLAVPRGDDPTPLLEAYRRNFVVAYALGELRKKFVPSERTGPQHGGAGALAFFSANIALLAGQRLEED